jgi:hypothetical protein
MTNSNDTIIFEENEERLKIIISLRRNWLLLGTYSAALVIWLIMLGTILVFLISGSSNSIVLTVLLLIWMLIWLWLGRFLSNRWQYYLARREILFIDQEQLMIRRPVSIFGLTTSYDFSHISPFYISEKHKCPAFDYAYAHVYFGQTLEYPEAEKFVDELNLRYFPETEEELM